MMKKVPKRRFKGFLNAGDWEQRKLSKLAIMNARIGWQNLRTSEFLDSGDYLLITGTDFDNGRIKYSTCHYVEKKRFDQDTKIQLSTGSILITKDGTLGKVALVEELPKPATLNAGVFNVRVKNDAFLSYKYLYHYLKAPFLMKYVIANATGGTIKHLNQSILVDFPIPITEKHEQDKIAKLLDSLESIITLHQRKLEKLQATKKALLYELFPIENSRKPKRRFKGFTGDWEQRKLGELVTVFSGQDYKHLSEGDIPVYGTGGYMLSVNEALSNDQDAIGIGRKGTIDKPYILKAPFWTVDTLFYAIPKEKMDLNFIFCIFKNVDWRKLDESTGVPSLSKSTITNVDVYCPFFEEQLLIGRFFSWIDSSITLHQ